MVMIAGRLKFRMFSTLSVVLAPVSEIHEEAVVPEVLAFIVRRPVLK